MKEGITNNYKRYGIRIDKNKKINDPSRVEYIYDAVGMKPARMNFDNDTFDYGSWKDVWFVRDNKPVLLSFDGKTEKVIDANDYTKYETGESVILNQYETLDEYTDSINGNFMSKIPLVYLYEYEDNKYQYIIISDGKYDNFYLPIAHMDENKNVHDYIYLGMYKGFLDYNGRLRSISSQIYDSYKRCISIVPTGKLTYDEQINFAKNNCDNYNIKTWGQRQLINALLMIMSCSENLHKSFGFGNCSSGQINPLGILSTKGQFYGMNDEFAPVKVFHIEDLWGNQWERINGCVCVHNVLKISLTGPYNSTGEGYDRVIPYSKDSSGYIEEFRMTQYGMIPLSVTSDKNKSPYGEDFLFRWNRNSSTVALAGGDCFNGDIAGAHCLILSETAKSTWDAYGTSLSFMK